MAVPTGGQGPWSGVRARPRQGLIGQVPALTGVEAIWTKLEAELPSPTSAPETEASPMADILAPPASGRAAIESSQFRDVMEERKAG